MLSSWNWTEVVEGACVSLLFVVVPIGWRLEQHARRARVQREAHHDEAMAAQREVHRHLGIRGGNDDGMELE